MKNDIYDNYIKTNFYDFEQNGDKVVEFEYNYRRFLPCKKDLRALDIGVGRGEMLSMMKECRYDYLGIDISPECVKFCSSLGLNCLQVSDTVLWLGQHKHEFDLITLQDVLEHIPKHKTVPLLKAIRNSLRPEGVLIIQVPNAQSATGDLFRHGAFDHMLSFTVQSLTQLMLIVGFSKFDFYGYETMIDCGFVRTKKFIRSLCWRWIRFGRRILGGMNPEMLDTLIFVVIRK